MRKILNAILIKLRGTLSLFLFFLIGMVLISCTEKSKPVYPHEGGVPSSGNNRSGSSDLDESLAAIKLKAASAQNPLADFLLPMASKILDQKVIGRPETQHDPILRASLELFNGYFLTELNKTPRTREVNELLERYVMAVGTSCESVVENCSGIRFFRQVVSSAQVLKASIHMALPIEEYYRRLGFLVELLNRLGDPDLLILLVQRMEEFPQVNLSPEKRELFRSMRDFSINSLREDSFSREKARWLLEKLKVWKLIFEPKNDISESALLALGRLAAHHDFFYESDGQLHSQLRVILSDMQKESKTLSRRRKLLEEQGVVLPPSLRSTSLGLNDEYLLLVAKVFDSTLSLGMAEILYTGLHSNEEKILKAIDAYVRTEFLYTLYQSHLLANENIFKAPLPPIKLLRRAIEERTGIGELWGRYRSNVDSLRDFYERISKRGKGNADTGQWELKSLFDGMDRNIKIFASYPHMMILFHIISDSPSRHGIGVDFDMGYMGSHGIVQLDSRNLMGPLFRGEQEPLFNYSKDMIKSNGFEMLYSFDFALRTHLFSVTGIDPDVFVAQVVRRFSGPNLNLVRDSLDLMKQRLRSSQDYKNFIKLCKTSEKSTSLATPHSIDLMELKYSPYFGNLILLSTVGVGDRGEMIIPGSGGLGKKALGFNYFDSTYSEAIEVARVDLASSLRLGRAMKSSYVSYLKEVFQLSDQEILSRTKNTEKVLNELSSLREEILNETKMRYKESGPCFYQSLVKDAKIQSEVLKAEQAYLRQVYREITELRNERTPEARRQDIEKKLILHGMPEGFSGLDRISKEGYQYNGLDLLIRIRGYLKDGLSTDQERIEPIAPHINVNIGEKMNYRAEVMKTSPSNFLYWTEKEQDFVDNALKFIFSSRGKTYLEWKLSYKRPNVWGNRMLGLASFYRMENESENSSRLMSAEKLLDEHRDYLRLVQMSDYDQWIFRVLHKSNKLSLEDLSDIVLDYDRQNESARNIWGLFDYPVRLATSEILGLNFRYHQIGKNSPYESDPQARKRNKLKAPERDGYWALGRKYFNARSSLNRGKTVLEYNHELDRQLDTDVRRWIKVEVDRTYEFRRVLNEKIKEYEALSQEERPRLDISLFQTVTEPWVSPNILSDYEIRLLRFHQETKNCFYPDHMCRPFQ